MRIFVNIDFVNHEAATIGTKKSKRADATNVWSEIV